jgi:hypothetical protein
MFRHAKHPLALAINNPIILHTSTMANTFRTYLKENRVILKEGRQPGITHVEDLSLEAFMRLLGNIDKLSAVQKLDGANLRAGIDANGEFYTSREQKGGKRFYKQSEFPDSSAYDGFKTATAVLIKVQEQIKEVLKPGELINLEILFGAQPNTVFYGKDGFNYIAFLEMLPGDDPTIKPDQSKIQQLYRKLKTTKVTVETEITDTWDGINLIKSPTSTDWRFTKSDEVNEEELKRIKIKPDLKELQQFLEEPNELASKGGEDISNYDVLKTRTRNLSDERKRLEKEINEKYKLPIKQKLMALVQGQRPKLAGANADGYKGIEGIIFTDPETYEQFKVVDRDVFTTINKFNYKVRNNIFGKINTSDPMAPIASRGGLLGEAKIRIARLFGIEGLEIPHQAKKVLANFRGDSSKSTLDNLAGNLKQLNFQAVKKKVIAILVATSSELEDLLDEFKENANDYSLELKNGKTVKYSKEIKRRTLLSFAEARKNLITQAQQVKAVTDIKQLAALCFGNELNKLHDDDMEEESDE